MNQLFEDFAKAHAAQNGYLLAQTLSPVPSADNPNRLLAIVQGSNSYSLKGDVKHFIDLHTSTKGRRQSVDKHELKGWVDVYVSYWKAVQEILAINDRRAQNAWTKVYEAWKELTSVLIRGYNNHNFAAWTIPSLYMVGKYLRIFAIKSDEERENSATLNQPTTFNPMQEELEPDMDKQSQLRDCEQHLKRIFTLCLNDRAPLEESRKWGIYFIVNLLFKTYFKLNSASLSRNILKTMAVYITKGDIPPLELFPKSQRVTFKYYEGILFFLEENYLEAERHLTEAWNLCHKDAKPQIERILTYLIPCRLLTSHVLPTPDLLRKYPRLNELFAPVAKCIKSGHLRAFDDVLHEREDVFVKRRIYLTLERGRDIVLRNLLRKVYLLGGFDELKEGETVPVRRTRIPELEFRTAISVSSDVPLGRGRPGLMMDQDEVECMMANMIYKDYMKGYIARERGIVVLSKKGAFPGTKV